MNKYYWLLAEDDVEREGTGCSHLFFVSTSKDVVDDNPSHTGIYVPFIMACNQANITEFNTDIMEGLCGLIDCNNNQKDNLVHILESNGWKQGIPFDNWE
jgi:hypothetical protein